MQLYAGPKLTGEWKCGMLCESEKFHFPAMFVFFFFPKETMGLGKAFSWVNYKSIWGGKTTNYYNSLTLDGQIHKSQR